jgi:ankyrin repeat protein
MTSCHYGNTRMVELLINANANLDLVDINSNTAWQLALENSYSDCVQTILNEMGKQIKEKNLFCFIHFLFIIALTCRNKAIGNESKIRKRTTRRCI